MREKTDSMGPERFFEAATHGFIASGVGQEEAPAVCLRDRKIPASPLLNRPVKAKEIADSVSQGEGLLPIGAIEIDQIGMAPGHQDIFELEVSVKEPCLMKLADEASHTPDHFPLFDEVLGRGTRADLQETACQVFGLGDFKGQKVGLVEEGKDGLMNAAHRLNR